jgi:hypothetical protein
MENAKVRCCVCHRRVPKDETMRYGFEGEVACYPCFDDVSQFGSHSITTRYGY